MVLCVTGNDGCPMTSVPSYCLLDFQQLLVPQRGSRDTGIPVLDRCNPGVPDQSRPQGDIDVSLLHDYFMRS